MNDDLAAWVEEHIEEVAILRETLRRVGRFGTIELYVQHGKLTRSPRIQPSIIEELQLGITKTPS